VPVRLNGIGLVACAALHRRPFLSKRGSPSTQALQIQFNSAGAQLITSAGPQASTLAIHRRLSSAAARSSSTKSKLTAPPTLIQLFPQTKPSHLPLRFSATLEQLLLQHTTWPRHRRGTSTTTSSLRLRLRLPTEVRCRRNQVPAAASANSRRQLAVSIRSSSQRPRSLQPSMAHHTPSSARGIGRRYVQSDTQPLEGCY
jgi:hypothetical protein